MRERSKIKYDLLHLFAHEFVGKVGIDPTDQPFGAVAHPDVHDVRADILLADGGKRVAKIILRNFVVVHDSFENAVKDIGAVRESDGRGEVGHFSRLRADGNLFIFDLPVFAFGIARDEKISFEAGVGKLAGTKSEKEQNEKSALIGFEFGEFEPFDHFPYLFVRQGAAVVAFCLFEGDQEHGIVRDDAACERIFENGIENDAQVLVNAPVCPGHNFIDVDCPDGRDRQIAENGKEITSAIAFIIFQCAFVQLSLFEIQPFAGDGGKRVFGCIIFTAVFFDVFRFGGLKKPRAGFFRRICGNADIVAVATIANDVKDKKYDKQQRK